MARRSRRAFSPAFQAKVVLDVLSGTASLAEACRKHQSSPSRFALGKALPQRLPVVFQADEPHAAAAALVAELERRVGQQALGLAARKKPRPGRVAPRP